MTWRLTSQFSGRVLSYVTWHFISHGPLQLLVIRTHRGYMSSVFSRQLGAVNDK
jgi:hypothetical protein